MCNPELFLIIPMGSRGSTQNAPTCEFYRDFLTGFRKRKQQRMEERKAKREEREKEERRETRRQVSSSSSKSDIWWEAELP